MHPFIGRPAHRHPDAGHGLAGSAGMPSPGDASDPGASRRDTPGLLADLRRGVPRSLLIASVVGTLLVLVNQADRLGDMTPALATRIALTYLTPFVVSMLGWQSAMRASRRTLEPRDGVPAGHGRRFTRGPRRMHDRTPGACLGVNPARGSHRPREQRMVRAVWNGAVIAESDRTVVVEGNHYFPPDAVKAEYLRPNSAQSTCHWKGVAGYYDVVVDGAANEGAAWYYAHPLPAAEQITGYVAFWKGVTVTELAGGA